MAATTADLVQKFIKLEDERRAKEGDLEKTKEALASLEDELLKRFEHAGTQNMKVNGHTVFVHRMLWAKSAGDPRLTVQALKESDLGDLVEEKFNTHRLSAYVRELVKDHPGPISSDDMLALLPKPLQGTVALTEKYSLRSRKG